LRTLGGKEWYPWGVSYLLPAQRADGSWVGQGYRGSTSTVDTCLALLFLKRADLVPGLAKELRLRVAIADPGADPKTVGKEKAPEEKAEAPLTLDLGELKLGVAAQRKVVVRGPAAFAITGVRGADTGLQVDAGSKKQQAHEVTVTIRPERAGDLKRTVYLLTDLPGRAEVAVQVQARVTAAPDPLPSTAPKK
jgi:hypothetical protein